MGSAGGLIGVVATDGEVTTTSVLSAGILASSVVNIAGALVITSLGNNQQFAEGANVAVGFVAAGAANSSATANSTNKASIGNNARITAGTVQVNAVQNDRQFRRRHRRKRRRRCRRCRDAQHQRHSYDGCVDRLRRQHRRHRRQHQRRVRYWCGAYRDGQHPGHRRRPSACCPAPAPTHPTISIRTSTPTSTGQ